tara:strand:+ start:122204 stop:123028 length:825 start_codon:yes stop_codon:yes gene_type:complete
MEATQTQDLPPKLNDALPLDIDFDAVFAQISPEEKEQMFDALMIMNECQRVLSATNHSVVTELLRFTDKFKYWAHVPPKDVLDGHSSSQYYYHAHTASSEKNATIRHDGEHGHFHSFMRRAGMREEEQPYPALDVEKSTADIKKHLSHILGISMDKTGNITGLFTTNRWVTGEVWYKAEDVIAMARRYEIDHAQPSWPVNLWMSQCFAAFMPVIERLLIKRDEMVAHWAAEHAQDEGAEAAYNVFEDRRLELTSYCAIDLVKITQYFSDDAAPV